MSLLEYLGKKSKGTRTRGERNLAVNFLSCGKWRSENEGKVALRRKPAAGRCGRAVREWCVVYF